MTDGDLIERARRFAEVAHAGDVRKGTDRSYLDAHLEPVAVLVRDAGGTDVQVAAAYLHDAAEDHGGEAMLERIRAEFGDEVAAIVEDLSDSLVDTDAGEAKAPWRERKQRYVDGLRHKPQASLEVSVADKLANATDILEDHRELGDEVWTRFSETRPEAQLWYYTALADVFTERIPDHPLTARLRSVLAELADRVVAADPELAPVDDWPPPSPV